MSTVRWEIEKYRRGGEPEAAEDRVVLELPLEIRANGEPLVTLMRLPGEEGELALGFCLTEGIVEDPSQVEFPLTRERERDAGAGEVDVLEIEVESPDYISRFSPASVIRTGSGGGGFKSTVQVEPGGIAPGIAVREEVIYALGEELTSRQEVFRGTGGTHGAGIFTTTGDVVVVCEDVGRHNALDKAVGWCAMRGIGLEDKILVISGRISFEMALKAANVRMPVVISMAAPTSLGLVAAERAGLTLVGFSDGRRFNVYTSAERIRP
ncbi:MAG: formate dehydrogenase accessory sulfurtransferase FdhD [Actinomycetota bacterium]|nr:formate dehydrogenase accessory sulfurtransferase FdhD [Actinomycetota bacterium]